MTLDKYYERDDLHIKHAVGDSMQCAAECVILHIMHRKCYMQAGYARKLDDIYGVHDKLCQQGMHKYSKKLFFNRVHDWRNGTSKYIATLVCRDTYDAVRDVSVLKCVLKELRDVMKDRMLSHIAVQADEPSAIDWMQWDSVLACMDECFTGSCFTITIYNKINITT